MLLLAGSCRMSRSAEVGPGAQRILELSFATGTARRRASRVGGAHLGGRELPFSMVRRKASGTDWEGRMIGSRLIRSDPEIDARHLWWGFYRSCRSVPGRSVPNTRRGDRFET